MADCQTGYRCNVCGENYWSANETVVTIERKEHKEDAVTKTVWMFHICDECLKKVVE